MKPNNFYRQALFHALDDAVETILDAENDDTEEKWSLADKKIDHVKNLGKAILSIGAVKGFEIGDGFAVAESTGLTNNDAFYYNSEGNIEKKTNHAGGILGGISDGSEIIFRAAIKPTPSIFSEQETVNKSGENISVNIKGRHDPVIVPRAVVVVECMAAITVLDALLVNMCSRLDGIKEFYGK